MDLAPVKSPTFTFARDATFDRATGALLKKTPQEVADTHVHPSSFNSWCRRREVFRLLKQQLKIAVPRSKFPPATRKLFEIGTAVHEHFRDTVLSDLLVGSWACRKCGHVHGPMIECPSVCANCGDKRYHTLWHTFRYLETKLTSTITQLTGATDGLINWREKLRVLELKTEREDKWKLRTKPSASHVKQAHAYGGMLRLVQKVQVDSAMMVYVNKNTGAMKAYIVPLSRELYDWIINEVKVVNKLAENWGKGLVDKQDILQIARNDAFTADAPFYCKSSTTSTAESCASCSECFVGRVDAQTKKTLLSLDT